MRNRDGEDVRSRETQSQPQTDTEKEEKDEEEDGGTNKTEAHPRHRGMQKRQKENIRTKTQIRGVQMYSVGVTLFSAHEKIIMKMMTKKSPHVRRKDRR